MANFLGSWESCNRTVVLLLLCASAQSITLGHDSSVINGLNILPSYTSYFELTTGLLALQSAVGWAGAMLAGIFYGKITDAVGRKKALYITGLGTVSASILQAAAQNSAMFTASRAIVGFFNGAAYVCGPAYLAETLPAEWRGIGLGVYMDFYYLGSLLAAGITYGSFKMDSTWAWRLPSALQGIFALVALFVIPFVPESPRWLVYKSRHEEALAALAVTHSSTLGAARITALHCEIADVMNFEAEVAKETPLSRTMTTRPFLMRLQLVLSVAVITMLSGNNIISFYLGAMLASAGITDAGTQLQVNIYLNVWCLFMACLGTALLDKGGRKPLAFSSTAVMTMMIFVVGILLKFYGDSPQKPAVYGTIAAIFLFQGSYSFAWTPLAMLYPPEVLTYATRSIGLGLYGFWLNGFGLLATMAFPYAIEALSWKLYILNGAWNVVELAWLMTWIETKGKTLEQIDAMTIVGKIIDDDVVAPEENTAQFTISVGALNQADVITAKDLTAAKF